MITNNTTNRDCVTASTAKESNLIDSLLFYHHKAESTIITHDLTEETLHQSQPGANISNSCLTADGSEEVTNDLMINNSNTNQTIDSHDLCASIEAAGMEYSTDIGSIIADTESDGSIWPEFHSACGAGKQLCSMTSKCKSTIIITFRFIFKYPSAVVLYHHHEKQVNFVVVLISF